MPELTAEFIKSIPDQPAGGGFKKYEDTGQGAFKGLSYLVYPKNAQGVSRRVWIVAFHDPVTSHWSAPIIADGSVPLEKARKLAAAKIAAVDLTKSDL